MIGPTEVMDVVFTTWRWRFLEAHLPIQAYSYGLDAVHAGTRFGWFTKRMGFRLHGPKVQIIKFIQAVKGDGTCRKVEILSKL